MIAIEVQVSRFIYKVLEITHTSTICRFTFGQLASVKYVSRYKIQINEKRNSVTLLDMRFVEAEVRG